MSFNKYKKKRSYYRSSGKLSKSDNKKTYLLRYEDRAGEYAQEGPFSDEAMATERLNYFLKSGVCSWLVSYNG